jgi:hypothetical protein
MSFVLGFPNSTEQVLNPPIYVVALAEADLATDAYVGLPIGATVLTAAYDGGDGAYIMKMSTLNGDHADWGYLSTGAGVGAPL